MTKTIDLKLRIGQLIPSPAPLEIMQALQSVSVSQTDQGAWTFQVSFNADRSGNFSNDYPIVSNSLLSTNNRIVISVIVGSSETVLIDGIITNTELHHSSQSGSATYTVTGQDLSVRMDIYEFSMTYPSMPIEAIVELILIKYIEYGITAMVIPTMTTIMWEPLEKTRIQNSTDLAMLNNLASLSGYVFRIIPTSPGESIGYFGPYVKTGESYEALNVNMGPATNVEDIHFGYDSRAPELYHGWVQDDDVLTELDLPILTIDSILPFPLASEDTIMQNQPYVRNKIFSDQTNSYIASMMEAQMATNRSVQKTVSGQVSIDTLRYGDVLCTPGVAKVRGIGHDHDGKYYISSVQHSISHGKYTQQATLEREGLGSTINSV